MSELGWLVLVAVSAVALASMALRGVARLRGRELAVYGLTLGFAAWLGGVIATEIDEAYAGLGLAVGLACVELGPVVGQVARKIIRRKGDDL